MNPENNNGHCPQERECQVCGCIWAPEINESEACPECGGKEKTLKFISLFSGIGGLDLGFERAGLKCVAQVEIDPFCQKVLKKHWPDVPLYGDITTVRGSDLPECDVLAGGFPCQDLSYAGKGAGIEGERSGLWREFDRLVGEIRPAYVVVENTPGLLKRGMGTVCGDLAARGYNAEWRNLRAYDFDLPHERSRVFIVAYADANAGNFSQDAPAFSHQAWNETSLRGFSRTNGATDWTEAIRSTCRGDDGLPSGLDRIAALGNAIVPQIAEYIGQCVLNHAFFEVNP